MASKTFKILTQRLAAQPRSARLKQGSGGAGVAITIVEAAPAQGGSGNGHSHNNLWALSQLGAENGYVMVDGSKAKAGYADFAGNLTEASPAWVRMAELFEPRHAEGSTAYVDEGDWRPGADYKYRRLDQDPESPTRGMLVTSLAWRHGCLWECQRDHASEAPMKGGSEWRLKMGNADFCVEFREKRELFDPEPERFECPLTLRAWVGSCDVTSEIQDSQVEWTRRTIGADGVERTAADIGWAADFASAGRGGKAVDLRWADLGIGSGAPHRHISFTARVTYADGSDAEATAIF